MGTRNAIGTLRALTERSYQNVKMYIYASLIMKTHLRRLLHALRRMGIDWRDRRLTGNLYMGKKMRIRIDGEYSASSSK